MADAVIVIRGATARAGNGIGFARDDKRTKKGMLPSCQFTKGWVVRLMHLAMCIIKH